jgi:hypothetical protein
MRRSALLTLDAVMNLALGVLLIFFPRGVVSLLGIPGAESAFYPSILGAVLSGIGIALLLERGEGRRKARGLGLSGAIAINLSGGTVLAVWLVAGDLGLPLRGYVVLWTLVVLLVGISAVELVTHRGRFGEGGGEPRNEGA